MWMFINHDVRRNWESVFHFRILFIFFFLFLKIIPLDITEEVQRQILSELDILFKCNSQFVIGFYGAFFIENKISICTEYMDGGSLDNYGKIEQNVLGRIAVAVRCFVFLYNRDIC